MIDQRRRIDERLHCIQIAYPIGIVQIRNQVQMK